MTSKAEKTFSYKPWVNALEAWYLRAHRKLPWRESHDPYRIWISEVMLQQTQVATVIPYYEKFLKLFPTVAVLAASEEQKVLTAWSGLGYYSRAKNLRKGAQYIVDKGGKFPQIREDILQIPGIGPYTGGAILSIAFDLSVPIVDGNVQRVFARFYGKAGEPTSREMQLFFWRHAEEWVARAKSPRVLNQALMELGATVCSKGSPNCGMCPIQKGCVAFAKDLQATLPTKKNRTAPVDLWWSPVVLVAQDKILLRQNSSSEWWSDLWDFPRWEFASEKELDKTALKRAAGLASNTHVTRLSRCRHTVTHHRIHAHPLSVTLAKPRRIADLQGTWRPLSELETLPLSSLAKKILSARETSSTVPV